jgi:AraC-like DNA-binding protein
MSEYITETEEFEALMIFVPDNFLKQLRFNESNRQISKTNKTYVLIKPNELLNSFKIQYMNYFNNSLHNMEVLLQLKLQELFMLLSSGVDQYSIMDFIHSATSDQPVDIDFILKKHLLQPLTIAELAVLSGRSLAAFKRDFHEKYHCSPKQWINQQRLNYAHRALLHTEKNVGEIAYECGFENISHFIKIYKRQYGFTPKFARAEKATI